METQIQLSIRQKYIIFTSLFGLIVAIIPELFGILAYPQFFVGLIQVSIALFKTLIWSLQGKRMPKQIQIYWLLVLVYFVIGAIVWSTLNHFRSESRLVMSVGAGYLALAWGIAVYHFNRIMFLTIK